MSYTVGVFGTSRKKLEKRVPIHPGHLESIDEEIRRQLVFEEDYGQPFGVSNEQIAAVSAGVAKRSDLFQQCNIALLAKPLLEDFQAMNDGTIHWGWPHCVQQPAITQSAVDRQLTLIAWEAMHQWFPNGDRQRHCFYRNNEMAGYAGVLHAMNLTGIDGFYGRPLKAVVISFGSVSQGALPRTLLARGVQDITVFTYRKFTMDFDLATGLNHYQFGYDDEGNLVSLHPKRHGHPFVEELVDADMIVNGILQDTDRPAMFVPAGQVDRLKTGCLIVDVSCDDGMGFSFAKPTSFENPMFDVGGVIYYAVDHTPSYLWNSASWEISKSLVPYLPVVLEGPDGWEQNPTIRRAIEIQDGVIQNPKILSFQNREREFPHKVGS